MSDIMAVLNVSGSLFPHANAKVVGNPTGLRKLKQALEIAVRHPGDLVDVEFVDSDGEYYTLSVQARADMSDLDAPYSWKE